VLFFQAFRLELFLEPNITGVWNHRNITKLSPKQVVQAMYRNDPKSYVDNHPFQIFTKYCGVPGQLRIQQSSIYHSFSPRHRNRTSTIYVQYHGWSVANRMLGVFKMAIALIAPLMLFENKTSVPQFCTCATNRLIAQMIIYIHPSAWHQADENGLCFQRCLTCNVNPQDIVLSSFLLVRYACKVYSTMSCGQS